MVKQIDEALAELCKEHGLTSISISYAAPNDGRSAYWTSYVHWDGYTNTGHNCSSESGDTASEAIRATINRANGERNIGIAVPDMALA